MSCRLCVAWARRGRGPTYSECQKYHLITFISLHLILREQPNSLNNVLMQKLYGMSKLLVSEMSGSELAKRLFICTINPPKVLEAERCII